MKNKIKKIVSILLAIVTIASANITALAASTGSDANNPSVGEDVVQNAHTEYEETGIGRTSTDVFLTVDDSDVLVAVPTSVIVSGTPSDKGEYIGDYSVKASGDISGEEVLSVSPKEANISLQQKGKNDISAEINQDQTIFTSSDLAEGVSSNGTVTAIGLTAGTWHGTSSFEIQLISNYSLYSSLELAASDANNLTTENADVMKDDFEHAVCGLWIQNEKAIIRMFQDESDIQNITFANDTELNLDSHTLSFATGNTMRFSTNCTVYNGKIVGTDASGLVYVEDAAELSGFSYLNIECVATENANGSIIALRSNAKNCNINASSFIVSGKGNSNLAISNVYTANDLTLNNSRIFNTIENTYIVYGVSSSGNTSVSNCDINIDNYGNTTHGSNGGTSDGIYHNNKGKTLNVDETNITVHNDKVQVMGIQLASNTGRTVELSQTDFDVSSESSVQNTYAVSIPQNTNVEVSGGNIVSNSIGGIASGLYNNGNCTVNGLNIETESESNSSYGLFNTSTGTLNVYSISINIPDTSVFDSTDLKSACIINNGNMTLDEQNGQIVVKGYCNNAVQLGETSHTVITSGYYTSANHGGLYCAIEPEGTLEITGGIFANNYNEYSVEQQSKTVPKGAAYFSDSGSDASIGKGYAVDIHNATFINNNECSWYNEDHNISERQLEYGWAVVIKTTENSEKDYTPVTVNLYDCIIESSYVPMKADTSTVINIHSGTTYTSLHNLPLKPGGSYDEWYNGTINDYR